MVWLRDKTNTEIDVDEDFEEPEEESYEEEVSAPITSEDFVKWRLSFQDIIDEFILYLKGYYVVTEPVKKNGEVVYVKKILQSEPLLPDEAIHFLLTQLESILNKTTVLSELSDKDIAEILDTTLDTVFDFLLFYCDKYNISMEKWSLIIQACHNFMYATLKRAKEGGERESLGKIIREFRRKIEGVGRRIPLPFPFSKQE